MLFRSPILAQLIGIISEFDNDGCRCRRRHIRHPHCHRRRRRCRSQTTASDVDCQQPNISSYCHGTLSSITSPSLSFHTPCCSALYAVRSVLPGAIHCLVFLSFLSFLTLVRLRRVLIPNELASRTAHRRRRLGGGVQFPAHTRHSPARPR